MCECGCVGNDRHYRFPGPGKTFYILTLSGYCQSCDTPSGFGIVHCRPGDESFEWYSEPHTIDGHLKFEDWGHFGFGVQAITGMLRGEFVEAVRDHLIGIDSKDFDNDDGKIDHFGAEAILEEMYDSANTFPRLVPIAEDIPEALTLTEAEGALKAIGKCDPPSEEEIEAMVKHAVESQGDPDRERE